MTKSVTSILLFILCQEREFFSSWLDFIVYNLFITPLHSSTYDMWILNYSYLDRERRILHVGWGKVNLFPGVCSSRVYTGKVRGDRHRHVEMSHEWRVKILRESGDGTRTTSWYFRSFRFHCQIKETCWRRIWINRCVFSWLGLKLNGSEILHPLRKEVSRQFVWPLIDAFCDRVNDCTSSASRFTFENNNGQKSCKFLHLLILYSLTDMSK